MILSIKAILCFLVALSSSDAVSSKEADKLHKRALQKSHEKPKIEKWADKFLGKSDGGTFNQMNSLVNLLTMIISTYLYDCVPLILYDRNADGLLLRQLFKNAPVAYIHGNISDERVLTKMLKTLDNKCVNYLLFVEDVMESSKIIGEQNLNKVVLISRSSQWKVNEFLSSELSQSLVNLLIVAKSDKFVLPGEESAYILYTHKLYTDGLGSSAPVILTSWRNGSLTRPNVSLFPPKVKEGFSGHRFIISLAAQPPFVINRGMDEYDEIRWDGLEVRLIKLLAQLYNFTTDFRGVEMGKRSAEFVAKTVEKVKANIGLAGLYVTSENIEKLDISHSYFHDCAAFISLTSTALPRYRAIMGPFHWSVWLALTLAYLVVIFPLAFSDKLTLKHLLTNPEEIENMFWYVFGTFTNCFSFGEQSWTKSQKITTRLLMGFYWLFTIITTACYTGSIIAFITLPVYPTTVDSIKQLISGHYQIGTLDAGGWEQWFRNSSDPMTTRLLKDVELLPNVESGLKNTTKAFFWPYAFLGSRALLDYIVRTNFTTTNKRSLLHISSECFVPYGVGMVFSKNSLYKNILNDGILQIMQSGFLIKFKHDIEWEIMRSATGKLLQANSGSSLKLLQVDDRALTLDDTQGMFLLLGAGFLMGAASLMSECFGGCFNICKRKRVNSVSSIESNPRSYDMPTPREKLDSIQYSNHNHRLGSILDVDDLEEDGVNHLEVNSCDNCTDLAVHTSTDGASCESDIDIEKELDKIFNFDELFGEDSCHVYETSTEELLDENNFRNNSAIAE